MKRETKKQCEDMGKSIKTRETKAFIAYLLAGFIAGSMAFIIVNTVRICTWLKEMEWVLEAVGVTEEEFSKLFIMNISNIVCMAVSVIGITIALILVKPEKSKTE